jgi:hypothetical protein
MEDLLSKALLQSGLGVVGVLAILYVIRELGKVQVLLSSVAEKLNRTQLKLAVLNARFNAVKGIPREESETDGNGTT